MKKSVTQYDAWKLMDPIEYQARLRSHFGPTIADPDDDDNDDEDDTPIHTEPQPTVDAAPEPLWFPEATDDPRTPEAIAEAILEHITPLVARYNALMRELGREERITLTHGH